VTQPIHEFRTVMRGYEPTEVDRAVQLLRTAAEQSRAAAEQSKAAGTQAAADNENLRRQLSALSEQSRVDQTRIQELEETLDKTVTPSSADITERAAKILRLAEEEAADLRTQAAADAEAIMADADHYAAHVKATADSEASEATDKADAEATRTVESANRKSDEILDYANREATTRREEAEAIFERQRARAAAAAADFEKTLAGRRDRAAEDFAKQMGAYEQALSAAEQRHAAMQAESDRLLTEARESGEAIVRMAREEANQKLDDARLAAERVRKESERELLAATARREAVTAQLTNVRQMLAALGAGPLLDVIGEDSLEAAGPVELSVAAFEEPVATAPADEKPSAEEADEPAEVAESGEEADDEAQPVEGDAAVEDESADQAASSEH
jgi:DivIVA domain-containing protein